jgi:hypothetical protein
MATCIFYEFILANKFPKDQRYCHNALVFAPDKTVLQSLREIQTFDKTKVIPPDYVNFIDTHIRFHYLDESGASLNTIDKSRFNIIVSNTQKIILKKQTKQKTPLEKMMGSGKPTYASGSVYEANADLYNFDDPEDESVLTTNQRFEKLRRLEQLGIYIDEAHHAFGNTLAKDMGTASQQTAQTSLRLTVDELAKSLRQSGTQVVACYNYTGTPYVGREVLPEVVYAFGLQEAIDKGYLKKVQINSYSNTRTAEFVEIAIADFLANYANQNYEGMLPKIAFFAATIDELQKELKPAVELALAKHNIPLSRILVNVGDDAITSNDDIREFNRLDTPNSDKQFILLVNKGREGWNCRSLFSVALFRKPKSKIFVLQATMRCLRSITTAQQTARVYLSEDNKTILDNELQQNFRISINEIVDIGKDKEVVQVRLVPPPVTITLQRVRTQHKLEEKELRNGIDLELDHPDCNALRDRYRLIHTRQEGLPSTNAKNTTLTQDLTHVREQRQYSKLTLVAEIARYLNKPPSMISQILSTTKQGIPNILAVINEFNELLYDWIIPRLFKELYDLTTTQDTVSYTLELVKEPPQGYYQVSAKPDKILRNDQTGKYQSKSFHLDTYCFDSDPERELFWKLIRDRAIKKIYFTGMLTHGQTDFYIQYIDPETHTVRSYYPDFLIQKNDSTYVILEVKQDNQIDTPVVQAKKRFAEMIAGASQMSYSIVAASSVNNIAISSIIDGHKVAG